MISNEANDYNYYRTDKVRLLKSLLFPVIFTVLIWVIKVIELFMHLDLASFGILPLRASGLIGIITAPLIHSDVQHLLSNTFAVFFLSWAVIYFYKEISGWVIGLIYVLSGFWVWFFAREAYHIGASGLIYGMATFLFFSGVFRKHVPLAALSLVIVFLYGGIIWGVFPTHERISWETHLTGLLAGIITAIYYRKEGPQRPKPFADEEEEEDENNESDSHVSHDETGMELKDDAYVWHYKETPESEK